MTTTACFLIPMAVSLACICRLEATSSHRVASFLRQRRHLLFPDPRGSETRLQVLFGLGLPMEGEVSMTLGYVLKCNYDLPYNASELMRQRRRSKRHEDDYALPRTSTMTAASRREGRTTRWTLYGMLESTMDILGTSGKACLLRAVCESAANPFDTGRGLLRELLHVFLTPSTTHEEYEVYADREYHAAEEIGRNVGSSRGRCASFYPECEYNPLDYFTKLA